MKYVKMLMNDQNIILGYPPPKENSKNRKMTNNIFWWMLKIYFLIDPFYMGNIIYLAKILRSLLNNKIVFAFLRKVDNSIATKLRVNFINNCDIFWNIFSALHNSMTKLCSAFLSVKINWKLADKIIAQFWSALKWECL